MKHVITFALALLIFILQVNLAPQVTIAGLIVPDFIIILLVCMLSDYGFLPIVGTALGIGLAVDTVTSVHMLNTLFYVLVAVGCGFMGQKKIRPPFFFRVAIVAAAGALKGFFLMFALPILDIIDDFTLVTFISRLPSALYTAVWSLPFLLLMGHIYSLMGSDKKEGTVFLR